MSKEIEYLTRRLHEVVEGNEKIDVKRCLYKICLEINEIKLEIGTLFDWMRTIEDKLDDLSKSSKREI